MSVCRYVVSDVLLGSWFVGWMEGVACSRSRVGGWMTCDRTGWNRTRSW